MINVKRKIIMSTKHVTDACVIWQMAVKCFFLFHSIQWVEQYFCDFYSFWQMCHWNKHGGRGPEGESYVSGLTDSLISFSF